MAEEENKSTGTEEENKDTENTESKGAEDQNKEGKAGEDKTAKSEKTFTQEQVTRMMTNEKKQGRNSVYNELGIKPEDTKMVNMFKAFVESQKSEEQKTLEKQNDEASKIAEANQRAMVAEAKAEAMQMGVNSQFVDDIVTLALAKVTGDNNDLKTIIGEFKSKYPLWFKADEEDQKNGKGKGQKGTGSSVKVSETSKSKEEKGLGARLAAQRKSNNKVTKSYWNATR